MSHSFRRILVPLLFAASCALFEGPGGPAGESGPQGDGGTPCWDLNGNGEPDADSEDLNADGAVDIYDCQGPQGDGEDGEDGEDWSPPTFAGAEACVECHEEEYEAWRRSGMGNALHATGGNEPVEPWDDLGSFGDYSSDPPDGYGWSDVSYVIGGWARKQVLVDSDGWVITGDEAGYALDGKEWIPYETAHEPGTLAFECATCHTTGYHPEDAQDGLEGVVGTWEAEGIQCERCHGNGSQHVEEPYLVPMQVERDAELCGECHVRDGDTSSLQAKDGYLRDAQQWTELFHGKKHVMDCVDCHDPHRSAHYEHSEHNPDRGMQVDCTSCHFEQAANQADDIMANYVGCAGCHMPEIAVVAQAEHTWIGDHPAHLFAINTDIEADQFSEDGETCNPWVSLEFACRNCHSDEGTWTNYSDEELEDLAVGYHD